MFLVTPIHLAFKRVEIDNIFIFIKIFWITDIILSLNMGFYKQGNIVLERKKILKNYFKFKFWFDIIALGALFN